MIFKTAKLLNFQHLLKNVKKIPNCCRIFILKCVLGVDGGGSSSGGEVVIVVLVVDVVVVAVVGYWWGRSGGTGAGDKPCKSVRGAL